MLIPAPCSHRPTAQRAIGWFLPLRGGKGRKIGSVGAKSGHFCSFSPTSEHRRFGRIFAVPNLVKLRFFGPSMVSVRGGYHWKMGLMAGLASVPASRVAYCDARNRRISQTHQLLKFSLPKSIPRPAPFAKFPPRFLSSVFQPKFPSKTADSPAPSTACRHSAEWAGHDQRQ